MLSTFAAILKALWPFLKESILQGGTVGNWLLRNIVTCLWIFMLLAMLCVVMYMGDTAYTLQTRINADQQLITALRAHDATTTESNTKLRAKIAALKAKNTELTTTIQMRDTWRATCGLGPIVDASTPCPDVRRAPPQSVPSNKGKKTRRQPDTQPPAKRSRFKDRIRSILGLPASE